MRSHLLKHAVDMHDGKSLKEIYFRMRLIKFHRSSFERQVSEAVSIQSIRVGNNLLNSKAEFNRCAVPRLALKMGTRNVVEDRMTEDEEDEQEKAILEKIKKMRRLAGKRRNEGGRGGGPNTNPAPKRRKVDDANNYVEEITPNMGEKRKNPIIENDDNVVET